MRQVFKAGKDISPLQKEWDRAKKQSAALLAKLQGPRKRGMMIVANTRDKLMVMGVGSCGDDWLKRSGLVNVADVVDVQGGGREVTMEQIYAWDPDIIYLFWGIPASAYIKGGSIPGQNWLHVKAARNGDVYDMPRGLTNWGTAKADSPLTLLWLVSKNYPHLLSEADFSDMMKAFYFRRYNIELSDELMEAILYPNGK
jgi:iron complex transport system substrate-binding protein